MKQKNKHILFSAILLLLTFLVLEGISYITLKFLKTNRGIEFLPINNQSLTPAQEAFLDRVIDNQINYHTFDPDLGWDIRKNGNNGPHFRANSDGLRANQEYTHEKPEDVTIRFLAFGDSFVHGEGVSNNSTWPNFLEQIPSIEALNFGVGAYGLDQAYIKYQKQGKKYETDVVLICFMTENIYRHQMVYWPFYTHYLHTPDVELVLPKPRFTLQGDTLKLLPAPLPSLEDVRDFRKSPKKYLSIFGKNDAFYTNGYTSGVIDFLSVVRLGKIFYSTWKEKKNAVIKNNLYNSSSEAFQVTAKIMDNFAEEVRNNGDLPVVIIFPTDIDFENSKNRGIKRYDPLLSHLKEKNYFYIDMLEEINTQLPGLTLNEIIQGHYSPTTNKAVADSIISYILRLINSVKK